MEQKTRKKKVKEYFRGTEVGLMIEVFQGDLKIMAESFDAKIESFKRETRDDFKIVKKFLSKVTDDLDRLTADVKEIKAEFKKFDEDKKIDKAELESLKAKVQEIEKELKRVVEWQKSQRNLNFA